MTPESPAPRFAAMRLALFYGGTFLALGILGPFWPLWLQDRGVGPEEIGLIFALGKFRQPNDGIRTEAVGLIGRNEQNRMRVVGVEVTLHLGHPASAFERLDRILEQFEQFCTVSQSVAAALPITLTVLDSDGQVLKG